MNGRKFRNCRYPVTNSDISTAIVQQMLIPQLIVQLNDLCLRTESSGSRRSSELRTENETLRSNQQSATPRALSQCGKECPAWRQIELPVGELTLEQYTLSAADFENRLDMDLLDFEETGSIFGRCVGPRRHHRRRRRLLPSGWRQYPHSPNTVCYPRIYAVSASAGPRAF